MRGAARCLRGAAGSIPALSGWAADGGRFAGDVGAPVCQRGARGAILRGMADAAGDDGLNGSRSDRELLLQLAANVAELAGKVAELGGTVDGVAGELKEVADKVDRVDRRTERLETKVDRLEEKVDANTDELAALRAEHAEQNEDLKKLRRSAVGIAEWRNTTTSAWSNSNEPATAERHELKPPRQNLRRAARGSIPALSRWAAARRLPTWGT